MSDEEMSYMPRGTRSGTGSTSVLQYLVEDLRVRGSQPSQDCAVSASPSASTSESISDGVQTKGGASWMVSPPQRT